MPTPFTCPSCQRIVYNRRLAACEFCGNELPVGIRLSPAEVEARDRRQDEWQAARKSRIREAAAGGDGGGDPGFFWAFAGGADGGGGGGDS